MSETSLTMERRGEELPERWSAQRKTEVMLRVVRDEAIDEVAHEIQVPVHELEEWRRVVLESGRSTCTSTPFDLVILLRTVRELWRRKSICGTA